MPSAVQQDGYGALIMTLRETVHALEQAHYDYSLQLNEASMQAHGVVSVSARSRLGKVTHFMLVHEVVQ